MANPEHLKILNQGVDRWNLWKDITQMDNPDLSEADLSNRDLSFIDLRNANLFKCNLSKSKMDRADMNNANLQEANLEGASMIRAMLMSADFRRADLSNSDLSYSMMTNAKLDGAKLESAMLFEAYLSDSSFHKANLYKANLTGTNLNNVDFSEALLSYAILSCADLGDANLSSADLTNVNLFGAILTKTNLENAILENAFIYGTAAWDISKTGLVQKNLRINTFDNPEITVDDLEVAQFIYLMLNNQKIRDVIDTVTSKAVLILGRFTPERKVVLDALKDELRRRNYLPIVFDFENSENRSLTETVSLLAKMSKFVIADITDAKSIPQELYAIVPSAPSLAVVPIISAEQNEYGMFESIAPYRSVVQLYRYESLESLLANIIPAIIDPALQKVEELRRK